MCSSLFLHLCEMDKGMNGTRREIHDNIDVAVRAEIGPEDRSEYLEFPDVPCLTEHLNLFLPVPDECIHD